MTFSNRQIEAAHNRILKEEKELGMRLCKEEVLEIIMELWWCHKNYKKAQMVLAKIDAFGFDEWQPRT